MKKARLFTLITLMLTISLFLLVGCKEEDKISSVSLKDYTEGTVIETSVGGFDFSSYKLVVGYTSGNTEELTLTEEMIAEADLFKFYQVGDHDITLSYGGCTYLFKLSVKRGSFEGIGFPENIVFTYDGSAHTVELEGNIPANAIVTYPGGNSFVNAGTYDVTAVVSCDGYATTRLYTTVTIECAKYDMSGVKFEAKELVYDGKAHSISISGSLPEGVSKPTYTINGKAGVGVTDVGEYTVTASFVGTNPNYDSIPDMVATLKITPAVYDLEGLGLVFKSEDGSVISGSSKIYDGKSVLFEASDKTHIGSLLTVTYSATDEEGNPVSSFKNVGIYTATMTVTLIDGKNYQAITPITRTFEIKKNEYDTSEIDFASSLVIYDGAAHKVLVSLPDGHDIKSEDIVYEYRLGDTLLEVDPSVGVIKAGVYTVTAKFPDKNENYKQIPDKQVTLKIEKYRIDAFELGFSDKTAVEYSGAKYEPAFFSWSEINGEDHDLLLYTRKYYRLNDLGEYVLIDEAPSAVGNYKCIITANVKDTFAENYMINNAAELTFTINFEIYKKELDTPKVSIKNSAPLVYNGNEQEPELEISSISSLMTVNKEYYRYTAGSYELMSEGLPTAAGSYKCVLTVTINDTENYTFSNGEMKLEYSVEFTIDKKVIDISGVNFSGKDEYKPGYGYKEIVLVGLDEINRFVSYYDAEVYIYVPGGGLQKPTDEYLTDKGSYVCRFVMTLKDSSNYVFSNGTNEAVLSHNFNIV